MGNFSTKSHQNPSADVFVIQLTDRNADRQMDILGGSTLGHILTTNNYKQ